MALVPLTLSGNSGRPEDRKRPLSPKSVPSTRPASNGPSAPCSLHISEKPETALAPRISCVEVEMRIPKPTATTPMLTDTAAQPHQVQRSRQDTVDGERG